MRLVNIDTHVYVYAHSASSFFITMILFFHFHSTASLSSSYYHHQYAAFFPTATSFAILPSILLLFPVCILLFAPYPQPYSSIGRTFTNIYFIGYLEDYFWTLTSLPHCIHFFLSYSSFFHIDRFHRLKFAYSIHLQVTHF